MKLQTSFTVADIEAKKMLKDAVAKMEKEALNALCIDYISEFQTHEGGADVIRMHPETILPYLAERYSKINLDNPQEAIMALVFPHIVGMFERCYKVPADLTRESVRKTLDHAIDWVRENYQSGGEIR